MVITKTHKILISIIVGALLFGGYIYLYEKLHTEDNDQLGAENINQVVSTTTSGTKILTQGAGGYTIEQVSINENNAIPQPIPDLNRPVTNPGSDRVSSEAIVLATKKILELQAQLKKNPDDLSAWLNLGIYQKMAGDYQGASISWQYAGRLVPASHIPFGNLGNLYAYFLKDNAKAEMYYKQAISKGPAQAYLYIQLAEVYINLIPNKLSDAKAVIDQGLKQVPNDPNLLQMKESLK